METIISDPNMRNCFIMPKNIFYMPDLLDPIFGID